MARGSSSRLATAAVTRAANGRRLRLTKYQKMPREDDVECRSWWAEPTVAVGVGGTPDEALEMLERIVRTCEHPQSSRVPLPAGYECSYCNTLGSVKDGHQSRTS